MKIEIEILELDEAEWEYLGLRKAEKGMTRLIIFHELLFDVWESETPSTLNYHCFRKKTSENRLRR
jgi:hypothetical protein